MFATRRVLSQTADLKSKIQLWLSTLCVVVVVVVVVAPPPASPPARALLRSLAGRC
jgi:hypothetical protein